MFSFYGPFTKILPAFRLTVESQLTRWPFRSEVSRENGLVQKGHLRYSVSSKAKSMGVFVAGYEMNIFNAIFAIKPILKFFDLCPFCI